MQRSSSNTRVADDYYRNSSSFYNSSPSSGDPDGESNSTLPIYSPGSDISKKERSRLRSAENAVHLIPLVLVLCAIILWFFSNPVDVVSRETDSLAARVEGLKAAGGVDVDGTQHNLLQHMELDDVDVVRQHHIHRQTTERKPSI